MPERPMLVSFRDRNGPLAILLVGTAAVGIGWLLTALYGPWLCHGIAATVTLSSAWYLRPRIVHAPQSTLAMGGSLALGVLLAIASWYLAPLATRLVPQLQGALQALYATLHRPPGPVKAVPILALSVLAEELVWRGIVVDWLLAKKLTAPRVVAIATATYVLPIVCSGSLLLLVVAVSLGTTLTIQRLLLRSWVPCYVTHFTWNLLVFVVHPVL